jgi:rubrerythrin
VQFKNDMKMKGDSTMQMQSQTQANQPQIPNPPRAITTKDLLYIKDVLSWELLAFKKFHHLAQQVTNPQIKQALEKAGQMHQNHYQRLLPHLQVNNNSALANLPNQQTPLQ